MSSWTTTVTSFTADNFARKKLVDSHAQPLTGVYEIDINSVWIKYKSAYSQPALLTCNLFTSWEQNQDLTIEKVNK